MRPPSGRGNGNRAFRARSTRAKRGSCQSSGRARALPLRKLRSLAGLVEAGFLALDDARVTGQEALTLERDAQVRVDLDERARDTVANGAGLAARAAAVDAHADVVLPFEPRDAKRRQHHRAVRKAREVLLEGAAVEPRRAVAGAKDDARDRRLALACAEVLRDLGHQERTSR